MSEKYNKAGYDEDGYSSSLHDKDGQKNRKSRRQVHATGINMWKATFLANTHPGMVERVDGRDIWGFDENGFDKNGKDKFGLTKKYYDSREYDEYGFDQEGYDKDGFDSTGLDRWGFDKNGFDKWGKDIFGLYKSDYESILKNGNRNFTVSTHISKAEW